LNTQQALKSSVAPSWDHNSSADEVEGDDANALADDDSCSNLLLLNSIKGPSVASNHGSKEKATNFMIDATVAKQLLKDLLVDPLSYSDFDHIPPITQAQLDFLLARVDSVVQPVSLDDNVDIGLEVNGHLNMEPILEDDDDNDKTFFDKGHGKYSSVECLLIRLLRILRDIGAPFDTYGTIMEMVADAVRDKVYITTTYCSWDNTIKHFANCYELSSMYPSFRTRPSPDGQVYPVVVHDAKAMIESLLYSPLMDNNKNLLFPNPKNPLEGPPPLSDMLAYVDTGKAYRQAYSLLCKQPNHLFCGIILYIDKIATDHHGHLSLEPVYFTLTMFNQKTRNKPQAWWLYSKFGFAVQSRVGPWFKKGGKNKALPRRSPQNTCTFRTTPEQRWTSFFVSTMVVWTTMLF
jgi:hypothetical protein